MDGVGTPVTQLVSGFERVSELLRCISTLRQLKTRAALCYPRKQGDLSAEYKRNWQRLADFAVDS